MAPITVIFIVTIKWFSMNECFIREKLTWFTNGDKLKNKGSKDNYTEW